VLQGKGVILLDRNQREDLLAGDKNKETAEKKKQQKLLQLCSVWHSQAGPVSLSNYKNSL
jgi:hypothetical protein